MIEQSDIIHTRSQVSNLLRNADHGKGPGPKHSVAKTSQFIMLRKRRAADASNGILIQLMKPAVAA